MFQIYTDQMAPVNQESGPLPAKRVERMDGRRVKESRRTQTKPLSRIMAKAAHLWHTLGRLRKVRIEVSVDLNESRFDSATR